MKSLSEGRQCDRTDPFHRPKEGVDSIVMGSRGLSGIEEFLLGSVSSKVTQYAEVPVFVVK